jgi:hypothetical protein
MSDIHHSLTDEFEEDLSGLLAPAAPPPAGNAAPEESLEALPPRLAELVRGIEPDGLREFMRALFVDIIQLLGRVGSVSGAVENGYSLGGVPRVFEALRKSSYYLLTNIETAELRVDGLPDVLTETLEATGFALRHELRRVFEKELAGVGDQTAPQRNVLRACALLENCFQQLTISLARSFDAGTSGGALFENYRRRRDQSLALRVELRALLDDVRGVEKAAYSVLSSLALLYRVRRFRYEFLHFLMYRDWEDFERFADALELCYESEVEMKVLLHKLSCYAEALLNQVQMRAVLTDK